MNKFDILAEQVLIELQYTEIAHGPGDKIWWINKGKMFTHVSKGTIMDNHDKLVKDADPDDLWHGRTSKQGNVIIIPPLKIYARGETNIPNKIHKMLKKSFKPKNMFVTVPYKGLVEIV